MKKAIRDSIKPDAIDPFAWRKGQWMVANYSTPEEVEKMRQQVDDAIENMMRAGK